MIMYYVIMHVRHSHPPLDFAFRVCYCGVGLCVQICIDTHLLYAENSVCFIFLLTLILVDTPTLIIDYHYCIVMFYVSWCRFTTVCLLVIGSILYIVYSFTH